MVEALVEMWVEDSLIKLQLTDYLRDCLRPQAKQLHFQEARILYKAGYEQQAKDYLRQINLRNDLDSFQELKLAMTFFKVGMKPEAVKIANRLLHDPQVNFEAAQLLDRLQSDWDSFTRSPRGPGVFR